MSEEAMQKLLNSFAKMGKQSGMGESVGRIWGFLLLKSRAVTQREIEKGTGYSRGLISHCLQGMEERTVVAVARGGRENHYSINSSLASSFGELIGRQYEGRIKLILEFLSELTDTITDEKLQESFHLLISEYKKLSIAFLLFPKIIALINETNVDVNDVEEMAKRISVRIEIENDKKEGER
jgi:DNA-binding transcriptional regulator GbsR (MarR family)